MVKVSKKFAVCIGCTAHYNLKCFVYLFRIPQGYNLLFSILQFWMCCFCIYANKYMISLLFYHQPVWVFYFGTIYAQSTLYNSRWRHSSHDEFIRLHCSRRVCAVSWEFALSTNLMEKQIFKWINKCKKNAVWCNLM